MTITCLNIINELNRAIDKANFDLIDHMTDQKMKYEYACIKPDVTYEYFYKHVKNDWEKIVNDFISQPAKCDFLSQWITYYQYIDPSKLKEYQKIIEALNQPTSGKGLEQIDLESIVLDVVASQLMKPEGSDKFVMELDVSKTIHSLVTTLGEHCQCQMVDIFKTVIKKYKYRYKKKFVGKSKDEVIELLRKDYNDFKEYVKTFEMESHHKNLIEDISKKFTGIYGFSVGSELDRLIPNELGSLKEFFIKVISTYFEKLHPIIWVQIFKQMTENIFIDLPYTPDELFAFVSKYLLLNAGPFILKILQMIRPVLTKDLQIKYNLTKLKYPQMKEKEVELVLNKVVKDWDMYKIIRHVSASVGHVCIVKRVDNPKNVFIIKIIKPIAIAQSCWEYKILHNVYGDDKPCEKEFIKHMLESNGRELNVNNEIENIKKGHEYYTESYANIFTSKINAILTTVENIPGIIKPGTWFALTMTRAPGIPLSELVEVKHEALKTDNRYRAKLHRCFDLLVYKFFHNLVKNGFYHGDLHAGNIFFSYEDSQMTLIDFGAVGQIDLYSGDPAIFTLLDVIIMSLFYNYDEILDIMTKLLNSRCPGTEIDMNSPAYNEFKEKLKEYKYENIRNYEAEDKKAKQYETDIFSNKRIEEETIGNLPENISEETLKSLAQPTFVSAEKTIYSPLDYEERKKNVVVEFRPALPEYTEILGDTKSETFASILAKIIEFYAKSGVNIAIKFSDFYELQKAYLLLLGVLNSVGYNSYRTGIAINKAIVTWKNIPQMLHLTTTVHAIKVYWNENKKFKELKKQITGTSEIKTHPSVPEKEPSFIPEKTEVKAYYDKYRKYKEKYRYLDNLMKQ